MKDEKTTENKEYKPAAIVMAVYGGLGGFLYAIIIEILQSFDLWPQNRWFSIILGSLMGIVFFYFIFSHLYKKPKQN